VDVIYYTAAFMHPVWQAGNFALTTHSGASPSTARIGMYKIEKIHIEDWISATRWYKTLNNFRVVLMKSISGS
jgi:hypothetical protein